MTAALCGITIDASISRTLGAHISQTALPQLKPLRPPELRRTVVHAAALLLGAAITSRRKGSILPRSRSAQCSGQWLRSGTASEYRMQPEPTLMCGLQLRTENDKCGKTIKALNVPCTVEPSSGAANTGEQKRSVQTRSTFVLTGNDRVEGADSMFVHDVLTGFNPV